MMELGGPFAIEKVKKEDLEAGKLKSTWTPAFSHPSVPKEQWPAFAEMVTIGSLLAFENGGWRASDEWNKLLPDIKFKSPEVYLTEIWAGKP